MPMKQPAKLLRSARAPMHCVQLAKTFSSEMPPLTIFHREEFYISARRLS
jgi:hypothetical protein